MSLNLFFSFSTVIVVNLTLFFVVDSFETVSFPYSFLNSLIFLLTELPFGTSYIPIFVLALENKTPLLSFF